MVLKEEPPPAARLKRPTVFDTERLVAVVGNVSDTAFFYRLWKNPRVMVNVGYPQGLPITEEEIAAQLEGQQGKILDARLVAVLKSTAEAIGECKLGTPDENGLSETDVKLLPEFWGHKYGVEIKRALVDYLFHFTDCTVVQATPNVNNMASIKMQEAVGGVRVGEQIYEVPEEKRAFMQPIHSYIYHVYRETWPSS